MTGYVFDETAETSNLMARTSLLLTVYLEQSSYIAENALIGKKRVISPRLLEILSAFACEAPLSTLSRDLRAAFPGTNLADAAIRELISIGILVIRGSSIDQTERSFANWAWGRETAAHFLATRRVRWLPEKSEPQVYARLLNAGTVPPLWEDIPDASDEWLPLGVELRARRVFEILGRRRTTRQFCANEISQRELGAILSSGLGIFDFLKLPLRLTHPLKFSPSPGGLNSVSGYIYLRHASQLDAGIYAYNGLRNQLHQVSSLPTHPLSDIFGNQSWANEAAFICVLCADCKKMSWKYSDQSAFNSLLIESGHIAQNMMICASSLAISTAPTNAIDLPTVERHLSLEFPRQIPLYAIGFGHRDTERSTDHYSSEALREFRTHRSGVECAKAEADK